MTDLDCCLEPLISRSLSCRLERGGNRKGGAHICLPVHCLSTRPDWQPYWHTNATSACLLNQEGTNVHVSNVLFVLYQIFGLNHLTPPSMPSFPSLLSVASTLRELGWAIMSPKKGQAMQRRHKEQSARSKCERLSPLD